VRGAWLFVEANEAARRLFLWKGFVQVKRRDFLLRGVSIHNYLMEKKLLAASGQRGPFPPSVEIQTDPLPNFEGPVKFGSRYAFGALGLSGRLTLFDDRSPRLLVALKILVDLGSGT
jgi:hypothetical protein